MLGFFETILNLSLIGSIVILVIMVVRRLLRRIPTKYIYYLWGLAAFRLLCPKSPSSVLSLFNFLPTKKISVVSSSGMIGKTSAAVTSIPETLGRNIQQVTTMVSSKSTPTVKAAGSTMSNFWHILMLLWLLGMAVLAIAILYKTFTMYRSLRHARKISDNVYSDASIPAPFILGFLKPRIFMPQGLSEKEFNYLLNHEKTHLRRKDMVFKSVWIVALIVHWFNPLVWIAYRLFESDMEMSCDEEVIKNMGNDLRADYCMSLVSYAKKSNTPKYPVSLLDFGKKNVKARIRNVMKFKKLSQWLSVISALAVAAIFACGFFSPIDRNTTAKEKEPVSETSLSEPAKGTSETTEQKENEAIGATSTDATDAMDATDPTSTTPSIEAAPTTDEPLWGTPEWIEQRSHKTLPEIPEVSLPDGKLFEMDLPIPANTIYERSLKKGDTLSSDSLGDFTRAYATEGSILSADFMFIATEAMSESELDSYIQTLHEYGFIEVKNGANTYIGYTQDGCYVIINKVDDTAQYTTFRFSSSTLSDNEIMGIG